MACDFFALCRMEVTDFGREGCENIMAVAWKGLKSTWSDDKN